jgi:hypothetical protein
LVYKAAQCCLQLLSELGEYPVAVEDCPIKKLRIHLGIGAGLMSDIVVGGPLRWEHFLAGDAVNQLSQVLDSAKSGLFLLIRRIGIISSSSQMLGTCCRRKVTGPW